MLFLLLFFFICKLECPDGLMRCQSGECIQPNLRCDGKADCSDSSDETGCTLSGKS